MAPEHARELWRQILSGATHGASIENKILRHLIEAAMVDYIENNVALSDTYAVVVGQRISTLLDAISKAGQP